MKTTTSTRISDIMTRNVISVPRSTSARELARVLVENEISGVPVTDELDRVVGVVSRTDLLLRFLEGPQGSVPRTFVETIAEGLDIESDVDPEQLGYVDDFMTTDPILVSPDEPVGTVAQIMAGEGVHRVIVADDEDHLLGIATSLDLLRVFPQ